MIAGSGYRLITKLHKPPISVGGAAVYPYNPQILAACARATKYPDSEGNFDYTLCRVIGTEFQKRIQVPRNMASVIPVDLMEDGQNCDFTSSFVPRSSEQARCISEITSLLGTGANFVFEAPTGMGKTWCTVDVIAKIGKKTIIVVTKEDILDQWLVAIKTLLGLTLADKVGVIKGDRCDVAGKSIVIAMVQSIAKEGRYPSTTFADFGLMVVDECHRIGADFFSQACFRVPARLRLGVSATPHRKDGREEVLEAHIGPVRVKTTLAPMKPRIIVQESPWKIPMVVRTDTNGNHVFGTDGRVEWMQIPHSPGRCGHIINMLAKNHARNKMIVGFVAQAFKKGRKVLVQSDRKDHLETIATLLTAEGISSNQITFYVGGLKAAEREKAKAGAIILATFQMTAEATDIPELDTLVMATPKSDVRQIVGRILRFVEGKKEPVVFDLRDSTSSVFESYAGTRDRWYQSLGIESTRVGSS